MPDATPLLSDWFGRGFATVLGAGASAAVTIFATRKNNEASVLAAVNKRIDAQFERYDAEIERLERQHVLCEQNLAELRALLTQSIPPYTSIDITEGQKTVKAAVARQRKRP